MSVDAAAARYALRIDHGPWLRRLYAGSRRLYFGLNGDRLPKRSPRRARIVERQSGRVVATIVQSIGDESDQRVDAVQADLQRLDVSTFERNWLPSMVSN